MPSWTLAWTLAWAASGGAALTGGGMFALRRWGQPGSTAPMPAAGAPEPEPARRLWPMEALLDLLPHPCVLLERDGSLSHANRFARARFGDMLGALLRHPLLVDAVRHAAPDGLAEIEVALDVPVRRVLRVALRADGADGPILLSLTDRTEQEAALRLRSDFIANASHELRTPLASLIGFIETLQGPAADDPPARVRFLGIMASQAARMRRLIDNLLNLSRIQMQEHDRPAGHLAVGPLLRRIADAHEPQVAASGIRLSVEIADGLPPVAADADQLAQVLHNLLDNALKHAARPDRAGQVFLDARAARAGLDPFPHGVVLSVADDGPGIPAHHIPRLTERFYRVEEGGAAATSGSGLGLAIVKHIVGRHGGRLSIDSRPGEGARFSVWLPAAAPAG